MYRRQESALLAPGTATSTGPKGCPRSRVPGCPAAHQGTRPGVPRVRRAAWSATVVSVPTCRRNRPASCPRPGPRRVAVKGRISNVHGFRRPRRGLVSRGAWVRFAVASFSYHCGSYFLCPKSRRLGTSASGWAGMIFDGKGPADARRTAGIAGRRGPRDDPGCGRQSPATSSTGSAATGTGSAGQPWLGRRSSNRGNSRMVIPALGA